MKKKAQIYDCLKKFIYLDKDKRFKNLRKVSRVRNSLKIIRIYENGKFKGYLKLDKLNRNLHIENQEGKINLFTDY